MRNVDLFGRRIRQMSIIYPLLAIFILALIGYVIMMGVQNRRLEELQKEQASTQIQINQLLLTHQTVTYHQIGAIIHELPNTYQQVQIAQEIDLVMMLSGLDDAVNVNVSYNPSATNPFDESLPSTVGFVSIQLAMVIDEPADILTFIDTLLALDRIYYIRTLDVTWFNEGGAYVKINIYTFYNDVAV